MKYKASTPEEYISQIPDERKKIMQELRNIIKKNLPAGFVEGINYGMIGYYVPHSIYPKGYHTNPEEPLPFINIASQKNTISIYHNGVYADKKLYDWFVSEYKKRSSYKLDMGKSCIRFRNFNAIPYDLIGELCTKMTVQQWIDLYEKNIYKKN